MDRQRASGPQAKFRFAQEVEDTKHTRTQWVNVTLYNLDGDDRTFLAEAKVWKEPDGRLSIVSSTDPCYERLSVRVSSMEQFILDFAELYGGFDDILVHYRERTGYDRFVLYTLLNEPDPELEP